MSFALKIRGTLTAIIIQKKSTKKLSIEKKYIKLYYYKNYRCDLQYIYIKYFGFIKLKEIKVELFD